MTRNRLMVSAASILLTLLGAGCALRDGDLALDGRLRIALSPPKGPHFYGVTVAQRGDDLVVSGFGRRPRPQGHVEVAVVGPDGTMLAQGRADPLPPWPVQNRSYNYRFRLALPIVPPAGAMLRVTYADSPSPQRPRSDRGFKLSEFNRQHVSTGDQECLTTSPAATRNSTYG